jgi:hypothetical protein
MNQHKSRRISNEYLYKNNLSSSPVCNNKNKLNNASNYINEEDENDLMSNDLISTFKQTPMYDIINRFNPINAIKSSSSTMDICR